MVMEEAEPRASQEAGDTAVLSDTQAPRAGEKGVSRRRLESRRKILAAARQLFVERGYHDTRPQDISRAAGVGHGTFYLHFADKFDCFVAFTDEAAAELEVIVQRHLDNAGTIEVAIREILLAIHEYSDANPGVLAAAMTDVSVLSTGDTDRVMPADRWAVQWAEMIDHWKAAKEADPEIDSALAGYAIVGATKYAGGYATRQEVDQQKYIDGLTRFLVQALKPR